MVLAGLDVATTTGITILDGDRLVLCGEFHFEGKTSGLIFRHCRKSIYNLFEKYEVKQVAAEQPLRTDIDLPGKPNEDGTEGEKTRPPMKTFQRIYGLNAICEEVCAALGIGHRYVNQGKWRKAFTGNGHATKDESLRLARLVDRTITSHDAAESMGVAWWLRGELDSRFAAPRGDLFEPTVKPRERIPF
jgi:hypothetical protein